VEEQFLSMGKQSRQYNQTFRNIASPIINPHQAQSKLLLKKKCKIIKEKDFAERDFQKIVLKELHFKIRSTRDIFTLNIRVLLMKMKKEK
jgi:hypothetical protein